MLTLACVWWCLLQDPAPPALTHGPLRGPNAADALSVWARVDQPGEYLLTLRDVADGACYRSMANATLGADLTLRWQATGLPAGAAFTATVSRGDAVLFDAPHWVLTTLPKEPEAAAVLAFGSCSHDKLFPEQPIWGQLLARSPQALVLLGDTPYIDLGTVAARRQRFREWYALPSVRAALAAVPTWATWDDHDYATNDAFGAAKGSDTARQVFAEYRADAKLGDGREGIYTSFRRGPVEVFLLDTRSCADAGPSPLADGARTLLGTAQWQWLAAGLRQSRATWKVLACGMVWNGAVRPGKLDCWGNWLAERDALWRWLGTQKIGGVVLVSGDVHRSRVIRHPARETAGYELFEFITSPLAQQAIATNQVDLPGLEFDAGEPQSGLVLHAVGEGADAVLQATFVAGDGREFHRRTLVRREAQAR